MRPAKAELLAKVVAWRVFSMCYGFGIAFIFTGSLGESAGIVTFTGFTLTFLQWGFEIIWDKFIRERLRNVISGKQGRADWMVWRRRDPRPVGMDKHKPGADSGEARQDSSSPQDAG